MPDSPEIHYNLANALRDLGRLNDAVASYRQALRLKPEHLKAYNNLGNVSASRASWPRPWRPIGRPSQSNPITPRAPQPGRDALGPELP